MRRLGTCLASTGSGGPGYPSGPNGSATEAGWTGTGVRREIAEGCRVPGSADQGFKTPRRSAGRRCRVLLSPGDPGDKPRLVDYAPFGAPSPLIVEGRFSAKLGRNAPRECTRSAV